MRRSAASSFSNIIAGSSATPAPATAAFAMTEEESNTGPRMFGQTAPAASNQRGHSS
jgi:hypothetical protein